MHAFDQETSRVIRARPRRTLVLADPVAMAAVGARSSECHENCRRWRQRHPDHRIARGFLFSAAQVVVKHSVIRTRDDQLLDVTPRLDPLGEAALEFAEWPWTDEQFEKVPNIAVLNVD